MALNDYVHKGEFDRRVKLLEQKIQESANRLISDYRTFAERVNSIVSENGDFNQYAAIVDRINSCFDTNGQFDGSHIAPLSIETAALSVGQRSQALNLKNVKFNVNEYVRQTTDSTQPNYYNYGVLSVTDENSGQTIGDYGTLTHYTLFNNSQGEAIGDATFNIAYSDIPIYVQNDDDNDKLHYIYAKLPCTKASDGTYIYSKVNNENPIADIIVDKEQKTIEGGDSFTGFLWILLGTISREFTKSNGKYRIVDLNYGLTTINGRLITTGRIEGSVQNSAYFDLDLGEIGGTIKFKNNNNNDVDINGWLADKYSTIWDALYTNDTQGIFLKGVVDELSSQIDGRIDTWFGDVPPSSSVPPEEDWTTTALKNEHVGDLYYDTNTGYAYRYVLENNTYKWVQLEDSDLAEALRKASKAQEAADGKISVFSGNTSPNPPYAKGDLWVNATFIYDNIKIYDNELLTCITDSYDKVTSGNYSPGTTYYAKYASGAYYIDESVDASNFSSKIASGIYTAGSFSINHWQPANRALAEIDNIIDDEIISKGSEKESLRREFESITATYSNILAAIGEFEVEADVETEKDALDDAYDALDDIMDIILDNINEDTSIINDLNMTTQGFRSLWSTYYSAEAALNDAIQKAAQDKIQATIDTANDELNAVKNGTTEIAGGMITSNLIELREITDSVEETYYVQCNNDSKFHNISNYYYTKSGNTYNVISSLNENTFNSNKSNYYIQKKKYKGGDVTGPVTSGLSGINNFPAFWAGGDSVKAHNVATYRNLYPDNIARYNQYSSHTGDIPSVFIDFDGFAKFGDAYVYGGKFNWSINTNELIIGNCKLVWDNTAGMLKFMVGDKSTTSGYYSGTTRWSTFNGIYSTDAISALGANSSGGGGGGGGINWADFWNELNTYPSEHYSGNTIIDIDYLPINKSTNSFYAPITAGTSGYFLKSNGSGSAPTWQQIYSWALQSTKPSYTKSEVGLSNVTNDAQIAKSVFSGAYQIMYSTAASTPTVLNPNTNGVKRFLSMKGTGSAGAAPSWSDIDNDDLPAIRLGESDVSGILPITKGGTGATNAANARSNLGTWSLVSDSYNTLMPANGTSNGWVKIGTANSDYGIIPSQSGGAGSGHNYLGTSTWYWKYAYIDQIYGYLNGNISGSSTSCSGNAATATKATQDGDGNVINTTYIKKSVLSGAYDLMYSSAANTPTRLAANTVATRKFLRMTGTGSAGTAPVWDRLADGDISFGGTNRNINDYGLSPNDVLFSSQGGNRFAFLPANQITIEYSRDGGSTWIDYGSSDSTKIGLFSGIGQSIVIGKADSTNKATTSSNYNKYMLRITVKTTNSSNSTNCYAQFTKFIYNLSTNGSNGCICEFYGARHDSTTTFTKLNEMSLYGWSGYNIMNFSTPITSYGNLSEHYEYLRWVFKSTAVGNTSYNGLTVYNIWGIAQTSWIYPSQMALTGNIYTYDSSKNVTFPANVSATSFNGLINGYTISSTVNSGTANCLAYYSGANAISSTSNLVVSGNTINLPQVNNVALNFRPDNSNYSGWIAYETGGNEAMVFGTKNANTSFIFANTTSEENVSTTQWQSLTPALQIKQNCVYINSLIGQNVTPSYNLYVNGTSCFTNNLYIDNTRGIRIGNNATPSVYQDVMRLDGSNAFIIGNGTSASGYTTYLDGNIVNLRYGTSHTSGLYLNASGNIGIGTTSPSYKLDVAGDIKSSNNIRSIGAGEHYIEAQNSTTTQRILLDSASGICGLWSNGYVNSSSTFVSGGKWLIQRNQSNEVELTGTVKVNGNFYATGAVTALQSSSSDKRLKKNIKQFNATEIIEKLKPVQFEWNNKAKKYNSNFKDGKNYGLIAQDSDGIVDDLVFDLPDNSGYKGVRYEKLIPILLQAVKEQQKEIDKLNSIVKQLKKK